MSQESPDKSHATPVTDAHLTHLNLPDGRKIGIPDQTVELLRSLERDRDMWLRDSAKQNDALGRVIAERDALLSHALEKCPKCERTPPFPGGTLCQDLQCPLVNWSAPSNARAKPGPHCDSCDPSFGCWSSSEFCRKAPPSTIEAKPGDTPPLNVRVRQYASELAFDEERHLLYRAAERIEELERLLDDALFTAAKLASSPSATRPKCPPAWGVTRMGDNDQAVLVSFKYRPTDNQLRWLHDFLAGRCTCTPDEDGFHAANCGFGSTDGTTKAP